MFTFAAMPVKFVGLIVLFVWCTVWCVYELTRPQDARQRVSNVLHLVMAVVMLAMVWTGVWMPFVSVVPMPVLLGVFGLSTAWFVAQAVLARRAGLPVAHYAGHAMMFAAMTWHLGAMSVKRGAMAASGGMAGMGHGGATTTTPMDMTQWTAEASKPGGVLWIFALIGIPFMAYLLLAGLNDVRRALRPRAAASDCACGTDCTCGPECRCSAHVPASDEVRAHEASKIGSDADGAVRVLAPATASCHEPRPVGTPAYRLSALADAAMNLGMFWMSTGLLVAIAPFMKMLSF